MTPNNWEMPITKTLALNDKKTCETCRWCMTDLYRFCDKVCVRDNSERSVREDDTCELWEEI